MKNRSGEVTIFFFAITTIVGCLTMLVHCTTQKKIIVATPKTMVSNIKPTTTDTGIHPADTTTLLKLPNDTTQLDSAKNKIDTSLLQKDSAVLVRDSIARRGDTTLSKDSLTHIVKYTAADSVVYAVPQQRFALYNKATADYGDINLKSDIINYNQATQIVKAYSLTDTLAHRSSLVQNKSRSLSDSLSLSLKTMKGYSKNTFYKEGEIYVHAETIKKKSATEIDANRGRFTTCNYDDPHFDFCTDKLAMISQKMAYTGPVHPEIEGIPLPIYLPFSLFPMSQGRHSGIIAPAFAQSPSFGIGLQGLGYYQVIGEHWDITTLADIYSFGGWKLDVQQKYLKRYAFAGNLNIGIQKQQQLNTAPNSFSEYITTSTYMINWSHTMDTKARPGVTFAANVNYGSTKYNQSVYSNPNLNYQNSVSSSISFGKSFNNNKENLSLNLTHNQNSQTRQVNLNLPTMAFTVVTLYPFQKKDVVGTPKWYEKIGLGYTGNFQNQMSFYDTAFSFNNMINLAKYGATHSIPISVALPRLGPITISPSISYNENWYAQTTNLTWNNTRYKLDTSQARGLFRAYRVTTGISATTRIFGMYVFGNEDKEGLQAIRHQITPTIGLSYTPDVNKQNYYSVQVDTFRHYQRLSKFAGGYPGAFAEGESGSVTFSLDNTLEMKVKNKVDTGDNAVKKIKLIDGFGFSSSYNLLADSFNLAPISLYLRSTLFDKVNVSATGTLNPYMVDEYGFQRKQYMLEKVGKLGRITNASVAISTQFKSDPKNKDDKKDANNNTNNLLTTEEQQRQLDYVRSNPAQYTDFNIPWSLSLSYALSYSQSFSAAYTKVTNITSSINFNFDFSLTEKWKIGGNGYINLTANGNASPGIQQLTGFITRDMHCWQLSVNITPVGLYRSFNITFNPKSGILRDLKINKSRTYSY